jgi:hypothetical protein
MERVRGKGLGWGHSRVLPNGLVACLVKFLIEISLEHTNFLSEFIPSHFIQGLKFGTYFAKILLKTYILPLLPSFHLTNSNWKRKLWINQSYNIWSKPKKSLNLMKKWGKYWKVFNDKYVYGNGWYYLTHIHLYFQNFI